MISDHTSDSILHVYGKMNLTTTLIDSLCLSAFKFLLDLLVHFVQF